MKDDPMADPGTKAIHAPLWRYGGVLLVLLAFLTLVSFHISDPLTNDEVWEFYASKKLYEEGRAATVTGSIHTHHPYGYYFLLSRMQQLFGPDEFGSRVLGILSTLLCFVVMLRILHKLRGAVEPRAATLLAMLYLLAPTVVQGSLVITADTGIHHLIISLFILACVERYPYGKIDYFILPVLCAAMFWVKVVTPALVVGSVALFFLVRREWGQFLRASLLTGLGGFLLFVGTWMWYCSASGLQPLTIFDYLFNVAQSRTDVTAQSKVISTARHTVVLSLWLGLPFAALMCKSVLDYRRLQAPRPVPLGMVLLIAIVLCVAHTAISGISIGFPRYHFSMMPLWAVILTTFGVPALDRCRIDHRKLLAVSALVVAYFLFAVGDPLNAISFDLKMRFLALPGIAMPTLASILVPVTLVALPFSLLLLVLLRRRDGNRATVMLLYLSVATFCAMNLLQAQADYNTGYSYGERGTEDVVAYCSDRIQSGREVIGCKDIVYHTVGRGYMDDWKWLEKEYLQERLQDTKTQFMVMGVQQNSIPQLRKMWFDEELGGLLGREYDLKQIGSFFVWERRSP